MSVDVESSVRSPIARLTSRLGRMGRVLWPPLVFGLGVALLWEWIGRSLDLLFLPPLSQIVPRIVQFGLDGTILDQLVVSLTTLAIGLTISLVVGFIIGALMGVSQRFATALDIYVNAGMSAPVIAFVPVFIVMFGLGSGARLAVVIVYSIWAMIINTQIGIRDVDKSLVEMGRSFGASRWTEFWRIRVPAASGYIMAGVQISSSRGVRGLISGEVLIAVVGLGSLVKDYGTAFSMDSLYAIIAYLIVLGFGVRWLTSLISTKVTGGSAALSGAAGVKRAIGG